ncbi:hypothetical protein [Mucilaginibacter dorajii]|uniref:Uncharacterized protein n=1 Tax=Mucilaginibacter dorajii TaxID=692994 RepID=A0ABP7P8S3_9SPHI|nr:hypothetical protein [Mucilaginibacter dorajii]MCS3735271.1 hypothetical protein [Mucilaginibacter dorajii]
MRQNGKCDSTKLTSSINLSENDFWADVPDEVKCAIDKAKHQLDRGEGISHDQVMATLRARFLNR